MILRIDTNKKIGNKLHKILLQLRENYPQKFLICSIVNGEISWSLHFKNCGYTN
jgi:hypothetical protein